MPPRVFPCPLTPQDLVMDLPEAKDDLDASSDDDYQDLDADEEKYSSIETFVPTFQTGRPSVRTVTISPTTGYKCENCYFYMCPCLNCAPLQDELDYTTMTYAEFRQGQEHLYPFSYDDFMYAEDVLAGWITPGASSDETARKKQT